MSPTHIPGYHLCPRCNSRNVYFALRTVGSVGNLVDLPEGIANPNSKVEIERKVPICRECGERSNWVPPKNIYSSTEITLNEMKTAKQAMVVSLFFACAASILLGYLSLFDQELLEVDGVLAGNIGVIVLFCFTFILNWARYESRKSRRGNSE